MNANNKKCSEIKKIRNIIIIIVLSMSVIVYFLFTSGNNTKALQKQVGQSMSLYASNKSIDELKYLRNDNNQPLNLQKISKNKWLLLYFGYASCQDVCPIDLAIINQTVSKMQNKDKLQVVFISVDFKRDMGNLQKFTSAFNTSFIGASANKNNLSKLTRRLGVYHEVSKTIKKSTADHANMKHSSMDNSQNYLINHTASYILLNPNQELVGLLTNPHIVAKMAQSLDIVIENY